MMSTDDKERLRAVLVDPSHENWQQAYNVYVTPTTSLWRAICAVDPNFMTVENAEDLKATVPDQLKIARAIKAATKGFWDWVGDSEVLNG